MIHSHISDKDLPHSLSVILNNSLSLAVTAKSLAALCGEPAESIEYFIEINESLAFLTQLIENSNLAFKVVKSKGLSIPPGQTPEGVKRISAELRMKVRNLSPERDFSVSLPYYERLD